MRYIGVDLGTSAVKLLLMEEDGTLVKSVSREYPLSMPRPGWSEQDPADWEREVFLGIRQLLEGEDPRQVGGIGVGGQMHGLVALDEAGMERVLKTSSFLNRNRARVFLISVLVIAGKLSDSSSKTVFSLSMPVCIWS